MSYVSLVGGSCGSRPMCHVPAHVAHAVSVVCLYIVSYVPCPIFLQVSASSSYLLRVTGHILRHGSCVVRLRSRAMCWCSYRGRASRHIPRSCKPYIDVMSCSIGQRSHMPGVESHKITVTCHFHVSCGSYTIVHASQCYSATYRVALMQHVVITGHVACYTAIRLAYRSRSYR
jgi:hypothetical protein